MKVLTVSKWLILVLLAVIIIVASVLFLSVSNKPQDEQPQIEIILPEGEKM